MIEKEKFEHRFIEDVERIQKLMVSKGYYSTLKMSANMWEEYSDTYCAGWLGLPESDEELFNILKYYYTNSR
jgi:predicted solute-binding protein